MGVWDGGRISFRFGDLRAFGVGQQLGALVAAEARAWFAADIDDVTAQQRLNEELEKLRPAFGTIDDAREAIRKESFIRLMKHSVKCGNAGKIKAAVECAQPMVRVELEMLGSDPWIFTCPNTAVDLKATRGADFAVADPDETLAMRKGWLRQHDRSAFPTRCAGAEYDPAATCPECQCFVDLIFPHPDLHPAFHRAMGLLLFGRNDAQVALLLRGPGGNGKSTATQAIGMVLGERDSYVASCVHCYTANRRRAGHA